MVALFILKVLVLQIVIIAIIVFILKILLDKQLIESAVKKFELLNQNTFEPDVKEITVITANGRLDENSKSLMEISLSKKFGKSIPLVFKKDKSIKGGIVIKSQKLLIDNSLIGRLKESGMVR